MPSLRQLEFAFRSTSVAGIGDPGTAISHRGNNSPGEFIPLGQAIRRPRSIPATDAVVLQPRGRDLRLEAKAREILRSLGATKLARDLSVEWNSRLKTAAGRADYRSRLISLNPQLVHHPSEIESELAARTCRTFWRNFVRAGAGFCPWLEWRKACRDLGLATRSAVTICPSQSANVLGAIYTLAQVAGTFAPPRGGSAGSSVRLHVWLLPRA